MSEFDSVLAAQEILATDGQEVHVTVDAPWREPYTAVATHSFYGENVGIDVELLPYAEVSYAVDRYCGEYGIREWLADLDQFNDKDNRLSEDQIDELKRELVNQISRSDSVEAQE